MATGVDPDQGETFTYELTDDADGRFAIDSKTGDVTVANGAALDYEAAASHDITIRVTDSGGLSFSESHTIDVNDVNEAPDSLELSTNSVPENSAAGTPVGTVSAVDPDRDDSVTFALADDADGRFTIDEKTGEVTVANGAGLDYETATSHDITVRVTDGGGLAYHESFTIAVQDLDEGGGNSAPTAIALDNQSVDENAAGALIGALSVDDPDAGDSHSFTVSDTRFEVVGDLLKLKAGESLDHEAESEVTLNITATDGGGLSTAQSFAISVENVNEVPTDILFGTTSTRTPPTAPPSRWQPASIPTKARPSPTS